MGATHIPTGAATEVQGIWLAASSSFSLFASVHLSVCGFPHKANEGNKEMKNSVMRPSHTFWKQSAWSQPRFALRILAMTEVEKNILQSLLDLEKAVVSMATSHPKPNL